MKGGEITGFNFFDFLGKKLTKAQIMGVSEDVIAQLGMKELAMQVAISYIANTLSKCEFRVYENNIEQHNKLYYMLNVSPNPNESSSQMINKLIENYYYDGSAIIYPHKDNHIYCADSFHVDDYTNPLAGIKFSQVRFGEHEIRRTLGSDDVFYFKLDNKNISKLIDNCYTQYGEALAMAFKSYKRRNGGKYVLQLDNTTAGDKKFQEDFNNVIKGNLKDFVEHDNVVYPQFKGTELKNFNTSSQMSDDIIKLRKEIFEVTAQAFKIPVSLMLGNTTTINEVFRTFLTTAIDPLADMLSEELTRKYEGYSGWSKGNYIKIDTSAILHADIISDADAIYKLVGSGMFTIDHVRKRFGEAPLNTEFSTQYWMTKNNVTAEEMLNGSAKGGEQGGKKQKDVL